MKAVDAETIDRVREAEGSENKIKVDTETSNQWLKIDAQEVLSKIHGFERTLNNHKRHTTIPTWAKSINSRLEVADAKLAKFPATPALNRDLNKTSHHLNDDQWALFGLGPKHIQAITLKGLTVDLQIFQSKWNGIIIGTVTVSSSAAIKCNFGLQGNSSQ